MAVKVSFVAVIQSNFQLDVDLILHCIDFASLYFVMGVQKLVLPSRTIIFVDFNPIVSYIPIFSSPEGKENVFTLAFLLTKSSRSKLFRCSRSPWGGICGHN